MEPVNKPNKRMTVATMLDAKIVLAALRDSFRQRRPRLMMRSAGMFVVESVVGLTTGICVRDVGAWRAELGFTLQIIRWLAFTGVCATFAEAVPASRGKA